MDDTNPLREVLGLVADDQAHTVSALADRLGVDVALLEHMLGTLQQGGYLETMQPSCTQQCQGCDARSGCWLPLGSRVWTLTGRGWRALADS